MDVSIPAILYKYRDWENEHHKKLIQKGEVYFTSPQRLNDPFDCTIPPRYDLLDEKSTREFLRKLLRENRPNLPSQEIERLTYEIEHKADNRLVEIVKEVFMALPEIKKQENGIFTLSKIKDSILMWSHYSNFHKGFCIGLNSEKSVHFFKTLYEMRNIPIAPYKVEYSSEYPFLDPQDIDKNEFWLKQFTVKSKDWAYEKEWRYILTGSTDLKIEIDFNIFQEVIFGCRMPDSFKDEIINFVKEWPTRPNIYQASIGDHEFGLKFEKVEY
jgi:hypothetical protein